MIKYFRKKGGFERALMVHKGLEVGEPMMLIVDDCDSEVSGCSEVGLFSGKTICYETCSPKVVQKGRYYEECDENGNKL